MTENWKYCPLAEIADVAYGYTEKASHDADGPYFLRITDIQDGRVEWSSVPRCPISNSDFDKHRLEDNDIVFARTGATTGKSFLVADPPPAVAASYLIRLRLRSKDALPKFVSAFFQTSAYWDAIAVGTTGSAQGGFNASKLAALSIPLPQISEQRRIVGILDEAFAGIAAAVAHAEKNLANARELFESYLNRAFARRDDEWDEIAINDLCIVGDGNHSSKYPKRSEMVSKGIPFIRGTDLVDGRIRSDEMLFISTAKHNELRKGHLRTGDVLFTNRGEIGKVAIVDATFDNANLNSQIAWLRCRNSLVPEFLFYFLQSSQMRRHFLQNRSGAALQQFTIKMLKEIVIPHPAPTIQKQIANDLLELSNVVENLRVIFQRKRTDLAELKQSILRRAFAGELTGPSTGSGQGRLEGPSTSSGQALRQAQDRGEKRAEGQRKGKGTGGASGTQKVQAAAKRKKVGSVA